MLRILLEQDFALNCTVWCFDGDHDALLRAWKQGAVFEDLGIVRGLLPEEEVGIFGPEIPADAVGNSTPTSPDYFATQASTEPYPGRRNGKALKAMQESERYIMNRFDARIYFNDSGPGASLVFARDDFPCPTLEAELQREYLEETLGRDM